MNSYNCCQPNTDEFKKVNSLSSILKLLAEENRLKLLCLLRQGEHCVCDIIDHFEMSQSLVSHHLADLREADLIKSKKEGRKVFYSLTKKGQKITNKIFSL